MGIVCYTMTIAWLASKLFYFQIKIDLCVHTGSRDKGPAFLQFVLKLIVHLLDNSNRSNLLIKHWHVFNNNARFDGVN